MSKTRIWMLAALVILAAFLAACGGGGAAPPPPLPKGAPEARILAPPDGTAYVETETVVFRGTAEDAEEGLLFGEALVWTSDTAGALGVGEEVRADGLPVGQHIVTLTATNGAGSTASATVAIEITLGVGVPRQPGDLVITEVHPNPDAVLDRDGEWFEVQNPGPRALDLDGLLVHDDGLDVFEVDRRLVVPAGGLVVFGTNADPVTNGGVAVGYAYTYFPDGFQMRNTSDVIVLEMGGVEIDRVAYAEGWPHAAGQAMELDPVAIDPVLNDEPEHWRAATEPYGAGDLGSPGEPNPACAP